jgi:glutathione S-transferase
MLELFYWPTIPGRGEFVRLVLEDLGLTYVDVARLDPDEGGGFEAVSAARQGAGFAPPILKDREQGLELNQTPMICAYLAESYGELPEHPTIRWQARAMACTIEDAVREAHDTHHPITVTRTYEEQQDAALAAAESFRNERLPSFVSYFERILDRNGGHLVASETTYVDLMLAQLWRGLSWAFPRRLARAEAPGIRELVARIEDRPKIRAYRASPRAIPFNMDGIFRRYPELDAD